MLVVPFGPGQTTDIAARIIAQKLSLALKQPIIVENRPGAGTIIGSDLVAKARPDGYTLLVGSAASHGMVSALYSSVPFDPIKDFVPVAYLGTAQLVLSAIPSFPATSVRELIDLAKAEPGSYNVATASPGGSAVLGYFQHTSGTQFAEVQYKTSGGAFMDVIGSRVPLIIDSLTATLPHINSGKVRALAVSSATRSKLVPRVPTFSEAGLAGFDIGSWNVIFAPKGTPPAIVLRLNEEVAKIMLQPETQAALSKMSYEVGEPKTSSQLVDFVQAENKKWVALIHGAGIKPQ